MPGGHIRLNTRRVLMTSCWSQRSMRSVILRIILRIFFYYYQPATYYSAPATEEGKHLPLN